MTFTDQPYTPRAKKAIALGAKFARTYGHNYIGTEHLLIGLLLEGEGYAAKWIKEAGLSWVDVQKKIESIPPPQPDPVDQIIKKFEAELIALRERLRIEVHELQQKKTQL